MNYLRHAAVLAGAVVLIAVLCHAAIAADSIRTENIPVAVDAGQYAEFMAGEVLDTADLAEGAEIQRLMFNRITPPGMSWLQPMFPTVVPFDAACFEESFLADLLGEDRNSVAVYPLSLALDPKTRETLVYNADGKLIATLPDDKASRVWPEDADPARVTLQLDLLPSEDVEPYLYAERRVAESLAARAPAKSPRTGGPAKRILGVSEFGVCDIQNLTNGNVRLTVTNGTAVAELYAYTVAHTSSVEVGIWTNEEDEVIRETNTLWTAVSPSFDGIDSAWECVMTNLACTNGIGVWEDANISANARVRFYAVAQRTDSDADGLTDGAEIFLHRTDPENPDTDGDGAGDGDEAGHGANARDPGSFPVNEVLEAALADINVAQIGYLSYLTGATFEYDSGTNYAQRIQQLRDALEGMAGSFLDLDFNNGGVLAEGSNVATWALDTVLTSAGSNSGDWLGGLASTSQVEEVVAVLGKLTYLANVTTSLSGYSHQSVASNTAPVQISAAWDLGTGYPDGWPTNQPIKTYLLLDTKVEILNVGPGTVDDWIEVNGTARFPGIGEIYLNHVADISAPVWNPQGANSLALWDCGDCAGDNNFAYLSPFKVVQVLEVPVLKVELFRDAAYTQPLDEWEETSAQLRSPKYILGEDDGIYIRVDGLTDTAGFSLVTRAKSGPRISPTYNSTDHALGLTVPTGASYAKADKTVFLDEDDTSSTATEERIKTQHNDLLEVELRKGVDIICTKSVMADLGEFAAIEGTSTPDANAWYNKMNSEYPGFVAGDFKDKVVMSDAQVAALFNAVDIGYVSGHGSYRNTTDPEFRGAFFADHPSPDYWKVRPGDIGALKDDAEWMVFALCSILAIDLPAVSGVEINSEMYRYERASNGAQEWGKLWAQTLVNTSGRPAHGLLGYRDGSKGDPYDSTIAEGFVTRLKAGETVGDAWWKANNAIRLASRETDPQEHFYSPQNAVVLMHSENVADKLEEPTADSKNANFSYTYIQWKWNTAEIGNVEYWPNASSALVTTTFTVP